MPECPAPGCGTSLVPPGETYCVEHSHYKEDKEREAYYRTLDSKKKWRQQNERKWRRKWRMKSLAYKAAILSFPRDSEERERYKILARDAHLTANGNHRGTNRKQQRLQAKEQVNGAQG